MNGEWRSGASGGRQRGQKERVKEKGNRKSQKKRKINVERGVGHKRLLPVKTHTHTYTFYIIIYYKSMRMNICVIEIK